MKKKILLVFGTRPEAIKMAPLAIRLRSSEVFNVKILVTGQHRKMLDQVLKIFEIYPDFDLNLMKANQSLGEITSRILEGTQQVFQEFKPDIVCVHGDTTTTFATSLAAFYSRIDVAHIEAGLRTHDLYSPYPEEFNRQVTSKLAKYHFAPTALSRKNLLDEGICSENILVSGNTVIDALLWSLEKKLNDKDLEGIGYQAGDRPFVLITCHRRENFGESIKNICEAIQELSIKFPSYDFVYPVHLNPNVRGPVQSILKDLKNVYLIEPLDYLPFVGMMKKCKMILTDSGGVQEEAPSLGKPVLVMRDTTERPEAVSAGTVKLVGSSKNKIIEEVSLLLESSTEYERMQRAHNPYGDGTASEKIVKFLEEKFV